MSIKLPSVECTLAVSAQRVRLPLALIGLLCSVQTQAFLPTPLPALQVEPSTAVASTPFTDMQAHTTADDLQYTTEQDVNAIAPAISSSLLSLWREQAQKMELAQHTTWRRLLYFYDNKNSIFGKKKTESLVDDPSFFLSENGHGDSGAELDAMLVALAKEMGAGGTASTQTNPQSVSCRFPARVAWIAQMLDIDDAHLLADCPELDEWMSTLAPEQLSIMFAQEYLDNPTSAFAHTLLRIDSEQSLANPNLINHAYALNYTVDGDPNDNFPIYATKSMIGSYNSAIEIDPYPEMLAKYLQDDERDAWTYQLSLTPAEVQQIMRHVWETKSLKLPYYFTTDNCASEILRLIDVVRPQDSLLSQLPYAVIPSDVIQLLDDKQLLANTTYTPADSTLRQAQLNERKQQRAQLGYHDTIKPSSEQASKHVSKQASDESKPTSPNPVSSLSSDGQTLLERQIALSNNNPVDRHPLQMVQIGAGQRGDDNYIDIGVRAGFHDTLDRPSGFERFFNLEGLAATVRLYDTENADDNSPQSVVVQNVTLLRGRSFNPVNTAKIGKTWGVSIEADRVNDGSQEAGRDHLVGSVGYESGWSWAFGTPASGTGEMPPQLCYALLAGTAQAGRGLNKGFRVGTGINAGCRYQINNQLRVQAQLQLPYWYHGNSDAADIQGHYWQPISSLGLQYDIDERQALRINASYEWQERIDTNDDIQLSYRRYF